MILSLELSLDLFLDFSWVSLGSFGLFHGVCLKVGRTCSLLSNPVLSTLYGCVMFSDHSKYTPSVAKAFRPIHGAGLFDPLQSAGHRLQHSSSPAPRYARLAGGLIGFSLHATVCVAGCRHDRARTMPTWSEKQVSQHPSLRVLQAAQSQNVVAARPRQLKKTTVLCP
jgi:hypothetical protein